MDVNARDSHPEEHMPELLDRYSQRMFVLHFHADKVDLCVCNLSNSY